MRILKVGLLLGAIAVLGWALRVTGVWAWIDVHVLHEQVRDWANAQRGGTNWEEAQSVSVGGSYAWLENGSFRIAHALGAAGTQRANTLAALDQALDEGFRLVEVDVWLDNDGRLRCHHGPPGPAAFQIGDCTIGEVIRRVITRHAWVVLDLKTDWYVTTQRILDQLDAPDDARSIIIQLYEAKHLAQFERWRQHWPLPGPMITAYLSHSSVDHIVNAGRQSGVRAFAIPLERLPALSTHPSEIEIFVHPIHNCGAERDIRAAGWHGIFTLSGLKCEGQ